jgi:L-amino acid N-acyltransferase YncA
VSPTAPIIRDATPSDAADIAAIYSESVARGDATMDEAPWSAAHVTGLMAKHGDREGFIVLEQAGVVLGWGVFKRYSPRSGYRFAGETAAYLRRTQTGRGYGSRIKRALIERCRQAGYHHLVARVFADNAVSVVYNQRLGYEVVGIQRQIGFRGGQWVDVMILQLLL